MKISVDILRQPYYILIRQENSMTKLKALFDKKWDGSQAEFCRSADIDRQRFNRVINGKEKPHFSMAIKIKKTLKVRLDDVYDDYI